jgi:hypothetical protein
VKALGTDAVGEGSRGATKQQQHGACATTGVGADFGQHGIASVRFGMALRAPAPASISHAKITSVTHMLIARRDRTSNLNFMQETQLRLDIVSPFASKRKLNYLDADKIRYINEMRGRGQQDVAWILLPVRPLVATHTGHKIPSRGGIEFTSRAGGDVSKIACV